MKKNDAADSSLSESSGHCNHNKEKKNIVDVAADVVAEEVVTIPHKPMKMPTFGRARV